MGDLTRALIYSLIAFSIVFIVLGGLTAIIYAMRLLTGDSSSEEPDEKITLPAKASSIHSPDVKKQHVAAIAAAILTATGGRGRILGVTPLGQGRTISSEATKVWRTAAIMSIASRRLAPSWKR